MQQQAFLQELDSIKVIADEVSLNLAGKTFERDSLMAIMASYHKRLSVNLFAIKELVTGDKLRCNTPIAILLRAMVLDYLQLLYLHNRYEILKNECSIIPFRKAAEFRNELDCLLHNQTQKFTRDLRKLIGVNIQNEKELGQRIKNFKAIHPSFPWRKIDNQKISFPPSGAEIIDELKEMKLANWQLGAYEFYAYYSKVDHFGSMSIIIDEMIFEDFLKEMSTCFTFIAHALGIVYFFLRLSECEKKCVDLTVSFLQKYATDKT